MRNLIREQHDFAVNGRRVAALTLVVASDGAAVTVRCPPPYEHYTWLVDGVRVSSAMDRAFWWLWDAGLVRWRRDPRVSGSAVIELTEAGSRAAAATFGLPAPPDRAHPPHGSEHEPHGQGSSGRAARIA